MSVKEKNESKNNILTPCRRYIWKKNNKKGRGGAGEEI